MTVVADTSPLNYLVLIGNIELLPELYGEITIARENLAELTDPAAPRAVRAWVASNPAWLTVADAAPARDVRLKGLDPGEREAIEVAL